MRYIIANWKQNKTLDEALLWCKDFVRLVESIDLTIVTPIICPPAPFLEKMNSMLKADSAPFSSRDPLSAPTPRIVAESALTVELGVQDISPYADGSHTGFVGINQVKQFCRYALVGHSERHESRDLVMEKVGQCLDANIIPIVCFKSPTDYRSSKGAIYALEDPDNISIGGIYRPKNNQEVESLIDTAKTFFGQKSIVVYGGSVNGENAENLALIKKLDGVLVGNASLNPAEFVDILRKFS